MALSAAMVASISDEIRRALDHDEFTLFYQPIIDLEANTVAGAEALLRWEHPAHGIINPNRFIRVAEESRLIIPLGEWVLLEACQQNREWIASGMVPDNFKVSINCSGVQLRYGNFFHAMNDALNSSGLPPSCLDLELTETYVVEKDMIDMVGLDAARQSGVTLTLDDFGSGCSTLSYIRNLPVDRIKIDRQFISEIPNNANDLILVQSLVGIAKSFDLTIVAEGIESLAQHATMKNMGAHQAQGYYYCRPKPVEQFEAFFQVYSTQGDYQREEILCR